MKEPLSIRFLSKSHLGTIAFILLLNIVVCFQSVAIPRGPFITPDADNIIYVDKNASGDGSGTSWVNAVPELADALKWASLNYSSSWETTPLRIFVAKGVYKPAFSPEDGLEFSDGGQDNTFLLVNNVHIYGGFDPANGIDNLSHNRLLQSAGHNEGSILSGNIGDENVNSDNNYHVVVSSGLALNAILDGFTITQGRGWTDAKITINGNEVFKCSGGGIYASVSSPILRNLYIHNNHVGESGGGYFGYQSSPTMVNVWFENNSASHGGGLANQDHSSPTVINAKFVRNSSGTAGAAIYNVDGSAPNFVNITVVNNPTAIVNDNMAVANISNSIIWGGIGGNGEFVAKYSLIENEVGDANGNMSAAGITIEDIFTDSDNFDYSLKLNSLAINSGDNSLYNGAIGNSLDLAGNQRLYGTSIDLGAYENQAVSLPLDLLSFEGKTSAKGALLQWQTANEVNFDGVEIERAVSKGAFSKIGYVAGKGAGDYQFLDKYAAEGLNYYRLKQIDKDGSFTYSKIVVIDFSLNGAELLVYPIPASNQLNLVNAKGILNVINSSGKVLKSVNITENANTSVNISNLGTGFYILQFVKSDGETVMRRILVDKKSN